MAGFDKNRFVITSEYELQEFICNICHKVLNNPVCSQCCGQTYCFDCINQWIKRHNTCPNDRKKLKSKQLIECPKALLNLLNKLQIKCNFESNGCKEIIGLSELSVHQKKCEFNSKKKCKNCDQIIGFEHNCSLILKKQNKLINEELIELKKENKKLKAFQTNNRLTNIRISEENKRLSEENKRLKTQIKELLSNIRTKTVITSKMSEEMQELILKLANEGMDKYRDSNDSENYIPIEVYIEYKFRTKSGLQIICLTNKSAISQSSYEKFDLVLKLGQIYFKICEL